ncbi:MAG: hypothetical protein IPL09_12930 [Bacteroidetes bacterium]|nr:hypothetical protein [Bacteroidota bacterium]
MKYLIVYAIALTFMDCGEKKKYFRNNQNRNNQNRNNFYTRSGRNSKNGIVLKEMV